MASEFQPFHYGTQEPTNVGKVALGLIMVLGVMVAAYKLLFAAEHFVTLLFLFGGLVLLYKFNQISQSS